MRTTKIEVTTTGANGSAAGTGKSRAPVSGLLMAIYIDYTSQPATADVTIATENAPVKTIFTRSDSATDGWFYPRAATSDLVGAALTDYTPIPFDDYVTATVAQGNAGSVDVYLLWAEG
jgi:hypothetical protein